MTLAIDEFIRRFLFARLLDGFHRIRPVDFLANGHRTTKLALCGPLLADPTPDPPTPEITAIRPSADRPCTRLHGLWRRDAGARSRAPSIATYAVLLQQFMRA